ncbi:MAG: DsbA family oxidoreductase [Jatrophihabitans sp.]|uniref:DsbA family oxidoreductase n=1 Tax=Jatrophihabitans sp. TaxID=1932789 RepID=UPI003F7F698E
MRVEIWSDVVCPWCYLGKRNFERALEQLPFRDEVEVTYRSFELDPSAPHDEVAPTVQVLSRKYGMTPQQAEQAQQQMEQRAEQAGLTFRMGELHSGNTLDAHRLLHLADARGRQAELVEALHRAYFTEQRSVFDHDSLTEIAVGAGLDRAEVVQVLGGVAYLDEVRADEELAHDFGADGVPFFVIDRKYAVSGAQPADVLAQILTQAKDAAA